MSTTPGPQYNLSPQVALAYLRAELAKMQAETDRDQLRGIDPDTAFEKGYALAIKDLESLTGPDPKVEYGDIAGRLERGETL